MTINQHETGHLLRDQRVEMMPIVSLRPYEHNARTHSAKQIRQIAQSIETFGFVNPVLIDARDGIIAGHGRVEAAKLLGMYEVPTLRLDHLTDLKRKAYILADNRLAELAGWDKEILSIELQHLMEIDNEFDITVTGFETAEIDLLFKEATPEVDPNDELPNEEEVPTVSQSGDCWQLGDHRLLCGDARDPATYTILMEVIYQVHKVLRATVTTGGREIPRCLVAP